MDDLISRAAAIALIDKCVALSGIGCEPVMTIRDVKALISVLPAVDAAPVVHARWTTERTWAHDGEWYCSACEYEPVVFMDSAFCPNCGAKMDGEQEAR